MSTPWEIGICIRCGESFNVNATHYCEDSGQRAPQPNKPHRVQRGANADGYKQRNRPGYEQFDSQNPSDSTNPEQVNEK